MPRLALYLRICFSASLLFIVALLASCASSNGETLQETATATPTSTPTPTADPTSTPSPTPTPTLSLSKPFHFSLDTDGTVGGLAVADEDIASFDGTGFSMLFDGSDVGLSGLAVDALAVIGPSEILLSFTSSGSIPDLGTVDDSDIVKFTATSLGPTTSGTFSMYFDGSDVGLNISLEDVDTVDLLPDGRLLMSLTGIFDVGGVRGFPTDILAFTPTSLGANTAGTWELYFDGSTVGLDLNSENVDGHSVAGSNLYLSSTTSFSVSGLSSGGEDVYVCVNSTPEPATACAEWGLAFDGSAFGLAANGLSAIDLVEE